LYHSYATREVLHRYSADGSKSAVCNVHRSLKERKEIKSDSLEALTAVELTVPFFHRHDFVPMEKLIPGL